MDTKQTAVYCYLCDDFVINDTPDNDLDSIRQSLLAFQEDEVEVKVTDNGVIEGPEQEEDDEEDHEVKFNKPVINAESPSTSSDTKKYTDQSRSLRPRRKRPSQTSSERMGVENHRPEPKRARKSDGKSSEKTEESKGNKSGKNNSEGKQRQKKQMKLVGLRNLGNTCFMSAVLQSLSNIQEFCRVLKQLPSLDGSQLNSTTSSPGSVKRETRHNSSLSSLSSLTEGAIMTEELRKVILALSQGEGKSAISPEALFHVIWKVVPRFRGYQQQDAHEFLRYMLDRLHTELLALLPGDLAFLQKNISPYSRRIAKGLSHSSHSLVTSIFGGTLQSEVSCLVCKTSSKKHDPFLDLSIDIPNHFVQFRKIKEGDERPKCQLHDCLRKFTDIEELADSERFYCGRCDHKQPSTKKFWIRRLPNVLCLHIKRFRWSPYSRTKIDTHVEFPLDSLNMSSYLLNNLHETRCSNAGSCLYDLAAVIVHHGSGAGSGHYTAFVTKDSQWYHFNDSNVVATDPETVAKSKAYILFYIQREFRLPTPS